MRIYHKRRNFKSLSRSSACPVPIKKVPYFHPTRRYIIYQWCISLWYIDRRKKEVHNDPERSEGMESKVQVQPDSPGRCPGRGSDDGIKVGDGRASDTAVLTSCAGVNSKKKQADQSKKEALMKTKTADGKKSLLRRHSILLVSLHTPHSRQALVNAGCRRLQA